MKIQNCQFKFKCTQTWDSLSETDEPQIKHCHDCNRDVHYCRDENELDIAIKKNWCVAIDALDSDKNASKLLGEPQVNYDETL
ncbi:MAG: hypothetical protein HQL46_14950 [Gammaproteobacteria bacterium]|nr:hypothetical protein [Gammaproteobacteria bacterium]